MTLTYGLSLREDEFHIWWAEIRQLSIQILNKVLYIEKLPPINSRSASFPSLFLTLLYGLWHLSRRPLLLVISPTITGAIFQSLEFIRAITRIKATHRSAIFNLRQVYICSMSSTKGQYTIFVGIPYTLGHQQYTIFITYSVVQNY